MQYILRFSHVAALALFAAVLLLFPQKGFAAQITITITDNAFSPKTVTINQGDTVRWENKSSMPHTVTSDNSSFDSGTIAANQAFGAMFNAVGTYAYHCTLHGGMTGTITVVTQSSSPVPTSTSGANSVSVAQLQAQIQALLNQVATLQTQSGAGSSVPSTTGVVLDSSSCPLVGRSLKQGVSGDDVSRLQQFLARDLSVYPERIVSGYYGALTEKAVQRWQVKYNIVSSGTPATTGYGVVGPRTAAAIALLCTTGSYGGISGPSSNPAPIPSTEVSVGGFISVSPISGDAPLVVDVVTSVNTTQSCQTAPYTLNFGDGSSAQQIIVPAGHCRQIDKVYPHTYKYGGTYTVKLSAGGHETTATVSVVGPPPPVFTPGLPAESFNVSPTSGIAPLVVTFSGIVNSNDAGFCAGGCASTLDFGDGTSEDVDLPASVGGWLNYSVAHTYTKMGGFRATLYQGGAGVAQPTLGSVTIQILGITPATPTIPTTTPPIVTTTSTQDSGSYNPPQITSLGTSTPTITTVFDLPSACTGFDLTWGDNSFSIGQPDSGAACAQTPVQKSFSHTYNGGGSYFVMILKRGPNLSRIDTSTITVSN